MKWMMILCCVYILFSCQFHSRSRVLSLHIVESEDETPNPDAILVKAKISKDILSNNHKLKISESNFSLLTTSGEIPVFLENYDLTAQEFTFKGYSSRFFYYDQIQLDSIAKILLLTSSLVVTRKKTKYYIGAGTSLPRQHDD